MGNGQIRKALLRSRIASISSRVMSTGWLVMKRMRSMPGILIEAVEKVVEEAVPFRLIFAVAVDVLTQKRDLFIALDRQAGGTLLQCCQGARDTSGPRV